MVFCPLLAFLRSAKRYSGCGLVLERCSGKVWNGFIHHLLWRVLKERIDRIFNELENSVGVVQGLLFKVVFDWSKLLVKDVLSSFQGFFSISGP